MTIKEVEQELGIPRANIRFYEKKNLLHPERGENTYREYSEEDVATLKKIIILRKIGISVVLMKHFIGKKYIRKRGQEISFWILLRIFCIMRKVYF